MVRILRADASSPVRFSMRTVPLTMKYMPSPGSPSAKRVWPSTNSRSSITPLSRTSASSSRDCNTAIALSSRGFMGVSLQPRQVLQFLRMVGLAQGIFDGDQPRAEKLVQRLLHGGHALEDALSKS